MKHKIGEMIDTSTFKRADVAAHLGIAPQNFSRMLKSDDIKLSYLISIAELLKVDVSDLIIGGKKKKAVKENNEVAVVNDNPPKYISMMPKVITVDSTGNENILFIPVKARAGYLLGYSDPEYISTLPVYSLPGIRNGTFRMFEATGSSMSPTIKHGDKVVAGFVEKLEDIRDNRVHVILTPDGVVIKRVLNRLKERGKFYLKSDTITLRHEFPTIELAPEDILEIWYAQFALSADLSEPSEVFRRISDLEIEVYELKKNR